MMFLRNAWCFFVACCWDDEGCAGVGGKRWDWSMGSQQDGWLGESESIFGNWSCEALRSSGSGSCSKGTPGPPIAPGSNGGGWGFYYHHLHQPGKRGRDRETFCLGDRKWGGAFLGWEGQHPYTATTSNTRARAVSHSCYQGRLPVPLPVQDVCPGWHQGTAQPVLTKSCKPA